MIYISIFAAILVSATRSQPESLRNLPYHDITSYQGSASCSARIEGEAGDHQFHAWKLSGLGDSGCSVTASLSSNDTDFNSAVSIFDSNSHFLGSNSAQFAVKESNSYFVQLKVSSSYRFDVACSKLCKNDGVRRLLSSSDSSDVIIVVDSDDDSDSDSFMVTGYSDSDSDSFDATSMYLTGVTATIVLDDSSDDSDSDSGDMYLTSVTVVDDDDDSDDSISIDSDDSDDDVSDVSVAVESSSGETEVSLLKEILKLINSNNEDSGSSGEEAVQDVTTKAKTKSKTKGKTTTKTKANSESGNNNGNNNKGKTKGNNNKGKAKGNNNKNKNKGNTNKGNTKTKTKSWKKDKSGSAEAALLGDNLMDENDALTNDLEGENADSYEIEVSLSQRALENLWAIFILFVAVNLTVWFCWKCRNGKKAARFVDDLPSKANPLP